MDSALFSQTLMIKSLDLTGFGGIFGPHMKIQEKSSTSACTELGSELCMGRTSTVFRPATGFAS